MIGFQDACKQVGYDRAAPRPEPIFKYFAYKAGVAKQFDTRKEALAFSNIIERTTVNQSERDSFGRKQADGEAAAVELWMKELRADYPELTDKQFGIIYDKAYEDGHPAGYDEVGLHFQDLYYFCMNFAKAGE